MIHRELNPHEKSGLQRIINNQPNFKQQGKLGDFFDLYLVCEATARKLIFYSTSRGSSDSFKVHIIESSTMTFFPSKIGNIPIRDIFKAGAGIRGNKTCRQLRNDYIHSLSSLDRSEIEERIIPLKQNMEQWINMFNPIENMPVNE